MRYFIRIDSFCCELCYNLSKGAGVSLESGIPTLLMERNRSQSRNHFLRSRLKPIVHLKSESSLVQGVTTPASCHFPFTLLPSPAHLPKSKCQHACKQNVPLNELMVWSSLKLYSVTLLDIFKTFRMSKMRPKIG